MDQTGLYSPFYTLGFDPPGKRVSFWTGDHKYWCTWGAPFCTCKEVVYRGFHERECLIAIARKKMTLLQQEVFLETGVWMNYAATLLEARARALPEFHVIEGR